MKAGHMPELKTHKPLTRLPDPPKLQDAMRRAPHIYGIYMVLEDFFRDRPDVLVGGRGCLCLDPDDLGNASWPDSLASFGLTVLPEAIIESNGYTISEIGKPPDFVLDVASESMDQARLAVRRETYSAYGVGEQWIFDPSGGQCHVTPLAGGRLGDGVYAPIPVATGTGGVLRGFSDTLGLELHWDRGTLRFWDPSSEEYLPDLTEAKAQRDAEAKARKVAEERVRQLESELRRMQSAS